MSLRFTLLAVCLSGLSTGTVHSAQRFDSTFTTPLAPGVMLQRHVVNAVPWNINVVTVDLRAAHVGVQAAHANGSFLGRESVLAMTDREKGRGRQVVAAINADFFRLADGEPTNNFVVDGEWWRGVHDWSGGVAVHSQFAVTSRGALLIDRFNWNGTVSTVRYPSFGLDGLNVRPGPEAVALFTSRFGAATPRDSVGRTLFEVVLRPVGPGRFRIADSVRGGGGSSLDRQVVLVGGGATRNRLQALGPPGTLLRLTTGVTPDRGPLAALVGGLPRLVVHGRGEADTALADAEGTNANLRLRHPRSAVGFSRDSSRLFLVTVDGRQPSSAGMDLRELSALMLTLGAFEALNLDGGGSTTLVAGGQVVNRPSDAGGPRTVANAILVTHPGSRPARPIPR